VAATQLVGEILEHGEVGSADEQTGLLEELNQWVNDKQANLLEAPEASTAIGPPILPRHASSFRPPCDD
jgi:hypothetical protein